MCGCAGTGHHSNSWPLCTLQGQHIPPQPFPSSSSLPQPLPTPLKCEPASECASEQSLDLSGRELCPSAGSSSRAPTAQVPAKHSQECLPAATSVACATSVPAVPSQWHLCPCCPIPVACGSCLSCPMWVAAVSLLSPLLSCC